VDFQAGIVRLQPNTTKNDEGREFPFRVLPPLSALLEERRRVTTEVEKKVGAIIPWVFHHDGGKPLWDYRTAWKNAHRRASTSDRNGVEV
jgi:hypothetical protein